MFNLSPELKQALIGELDKFQGGVLKTITNPDYHLSLNAKQEVISKMQRVISDFYFDLDLDSKEENIND